ncbi:Arc family DNA binding domain-containing protein [Oleiagrimonas sp. C23AA]|uniref:Arc family DNA binding domain-containing protein n=1 Tax=Oleiagrimonas sp. C23AA TaxID=2719047 RepID=UPI0014235B04|nr:Arc family DNA binding domain-containing protein [Oleiagrimonas sp. C23AA]NII11685.1 Arc family DNA binding domain-containing protein [Oleiagrimonas sp. C23AA]
MASSKKAYPLRISATVLEAMQRWSEDELRSLNAQIEYVLRDALRAQGRLTPTRTDALPDDPVD